MPLIKLGNWNEINRAETLTESVYKNEKKQKKNKVGKMSKRLYSMAVRNVYHCVGSALWNKQKSDWCKKKNLLIKLQLLR